ncbi:MAG: cytochrome c oxidase subunit II [Bacteroidetes bacterium]|nr:MAG: cytochrome c oxidase subunit II [Bacteroidota bacterium]
MGDQSTGWLPDPMSTFAGEVDTLFYFTLYVSTIIFVAVMAAMVYFGIRYRRRSETEVPEFVRESRILETTWVVVPTILVMIVFTWGFKVFVDLQTAPPDSYEITVRGAQWFWEFQYDTGVTSANELYVPVNRPIKLRMTGSDVLHSFFIPAFRVKMDVIPNRYTSVWFEAIEIGTYQVFCTEYCGTNHSAMLATVHVVSQEDFDAWMVAQDQDLPPAELGERLFRQYTCVVCHVDTSVGPNLAGIFGSERELTDGSTVIADEDYLLESIVNPSAKVSSGYGLQMPATFGTMSQKQLDGLIAYIKTL